MSPEQVDDRLSGSRVAVLSVSRPGRGPVAVPIWYEYADGLIRIITSPDSLHGRLVQRVGRATITVHSESYGHTHTREWYVIAEGPARFSDESIEDTVRRTRRRYYRGPRVEEWVARPLPTTQRALVVRPETLSGYEWTEHL